MCTVNGYQTINVMLFIMIIVVQMKKVTKELD